MEGRWQAIESKLRRVKDRLATAGTVVRKRASASGDAWALRFRYREGNRWRQRSIYLGHARMAERARSLIRRWRAEAVTDEVRRRLELLGLLDLTASAKGYSRRARRRVKVSALQAFGDPLAELRLVHAVRDDERLLRSGRPPGRPAKSRLW